MPTAPTGRRVALVTLGCGRNEVDSEELAGRLAADGWLLVAEPGDADVALVNTCGFVEAAKKDSVDTLLAAATSRRVAGPRRWWRGLPGRAVRRAAGRGAAGGRCGARLRRLRGHLRAPAGILAGEAHVPHVPRDRRRLLPIAPADRPRPSRPDLPAGLAPRPGRSRCGCDSATGRPLP
jgi:hypothetical protein